MEVQTTRFGCAEPIEVAEDALLTFPHGLPGFEDHTRFALIEEAGYAPFCWLQSLHEPAVGFTLVDPFLLRPDYDFELGDPDVALLELDGSVPPRVFTILVVPSDVQAMTANLKAPVVINPRLSLGKQVILTDDRYPLRHAVLMAPAEMHAAGV